MPAHFPDTSYSLLSRLKNPDENDPWQDSWKRFLELYHDPIKAFANNCYINLTNGQKPNSGLIDDAVANTVVVFFHGRFDKTRCHLRSYLRMLVKARVIDLLRKERPIDHMPLTESEGQDETPVIDDGPPESQAFRRALLATLVEDLRNRIPMRQFECFERVKLKSQAPQIVARDLGITRAMVDRNIYKAMLVLKELAALPEYQEEYAD